VLCALAFQKAVAEQNAALPGEQWLQYRIGINLGDVIAASDDIYGDSVNVAARLQSLAEPDGVCISGGVYDKIKNKLPVQVPVSRRGEVEKYCRSGACLSRRAGSADLPGQNRRWWLPVGAALAVAATSAAWFAWVATPVDRQIGPGEGNATLTDPRAIASAESSSKEAGDPGQHREIVFQRMTTVSIGARSTAWLAKLA
jgi:hypothetical protein